MQHVCVHNGVVEGEGETRLSHFMTEAAKRRRKKRQASGRPEKEEESEGATYANFLSPPSLPLPPRPYVRAFFVASSLSPSLSAVNAGTTSALHEREAKFLTGDMPRHRAVAATKEIQYSQM